MDDFIIDANIKLIELQLRTSGRHVDAAAGKDYESIAEEYVSLKTRGYEELGYNFLSEEQSMAVLRIIGQCENKLRLIKQTMKGQNISNRAS